MIKSYLELPVSEDLNLPLCSTKLVERFVIGAG